MYPLFNSEGRKLSTTWAMVRSDIVPLPMFSMTAAFTQIHLMLKTLAECLFMNRARDISKIFYTV